MRMSIEPVLTKWHGAVLRVVSLAQDAPSIGVQRLRRAARTEPRIKIQRPAIPIRRARTAMRARVPATTEKHPDMILILLTLHIEVVAVISVRPIS